MRRILPFLLALSALAPLPLRAQDGAPGTWRPDLSVNSELERYLRNLQVGGVVPLYPWSVRGFSPGELDRLAPADSAHPWAERYPLQADPPGGLRVSVLHPETRAIYNSAFPFGGNDGALWAGRGITTSLQAGFVARVGPLSLQVAPVVFWAQNADFELMPVRQVGAPEFADPQLPTRIDAPQRFGDEPYARLDPGQSTLRLDALGLSAGVSTANQHWGPAVEHPILLGNNAPGFTHVFLGTASPRPIWIGRFQGRLTWGRIDQSEYSSAEQPFRHRFTAGAVGVFQPRGLDGLEVGIGRFYHIPGGTISWDRILKPLEAFTKVGLPLTGIGQDSRSEAADQLASVFARWVFPARGMEVYGEFGRGDHNWDLDDLVLEPDHSSAYMLGFRKLLGRSPTGMVSVRAEAINTQRSHLLWERHQGLYYRHSGSVQGHTSRGQVLGSQAGFGGGGSTLAADIYRGWGRWSVEWSRMRVRDRWLVLRPEALDLRGAEVVHALGGEAVWFRGPVDVAAGVRTVLNLNRYFQRDAFNLNATLGLRYGIGR